MRNALPQPPAAIVVHGGVGGPRENDDGCERAAEAGLHALRDGGPALDAAVRAVMVMEDDERMNAGTGSAIRLDGRTIEMDAAVMDDTLRCGAVAAIRRVRHPVQVARRVMDTPHVLLAGEGACAFARAQGFGDHDPWTSRSAFRLERVRRFLEAHGAGAFGRWSGVDPARFWNFPEDAAAALKRLVDPGDTVGAVVRDGSGRFAAALSTGGSQLMLLGRVGDTPIVGAGLYAGPGGAVAATGEGEEIIRRVLAKTVYDWIEAGVPPQDAVERGVALYPDHFDIGLIAVGRAGEGIADNRTMPRAVGYLA